MNVVSGILKVLSWAVYAIIVAALLIASPLLVGYQAVVVLSGSMLPDYPVGSVTYYKQADFDEIEVGDVITFDLGSESLASHRVVEIDQDAQEFVTKGDNNDTNDSNPVSYSEVQGKATSIAIPFAGYFVVYMQKWYAIAACAAILVLEMLLSKDKSSQKAKTIGKYRSK